MIVCLRVFAGHCAVHAERRHGEEAGHQQGLPHRRLPQGARTGQAVRERGETCTIQQLSQACSFLLWPGPMVYIIRGYLQLCCIFLHKVMNWLSTLASEISQN